MHPSKNFSQRAEPKETNEILLMLMNIDGYAISEKGLMNDQ